MNRECRCRVRGKGKPKTGLIDETIAAGNGKPLAMSTSPRKKVPNESENEYWKKLHIWKGFEFVRQIYSFGW